MPNIKNWLEEPQGDYQASWIFDHIRKLGYDGGYTIVKDAVRAIKEENSRIAYVRFETEPGRQAQVDFGDFKVERQDGSDRTLYLFSMILGFSREPYEEYLERCDMVSFLDAHQRAFSHFEGVPAEILYDRMKNVFIRKLSGKAQFTQGLMTLANHYGFTPEVAPAYAPWVKGKVERPMYTCARASGAATSSRILRPRTGTFMRGAKSSQSGFTERQKNESWIASSARRAS